MKETMSSRDIKNVCRLCLSSQEPKSSVFSDQAFAAVPLVTKIQTYLSIEITPNDKVSTLICTQCVKKVSNWHTYKECCLFSQQHLKQYLNERSESVCIVKTEPVDYETPQSPLISVAPSSDDDGIVERLDDLVETAIQPVWEDGPALIKREIEEMETNSVTAEVESVGSTELLLNPMAVGTHKDTDRLMEADSTQKSSHTAATGRGYKKKARRGPLTHFRGLRRYKQRCAICQIYLHSKHSYMQHMDRFHSGKVHVRKKKAIKSLDSVESIGESVNEEKRSEIMDAEDEEGDVMNFEKEPPLTPVQQNIISQLKTFSCYTCRIVFTDRRATLSHIRQHIPDLRSYTCIACLTEFGDRSIYKLHCGASFQCAMKIALVVPEHGTEKYFTCNMCLRSLANRKELLSHLAKHSKTQCDGAMPAPLKSAPRPKRPSSLVASTPNVPRNESAFKRRKVEVSIPLPYNDGDPDHNNVCSHCGMIYKHKSNLIKHVLLCEKLPPQSRVSFRCIHCGLTYLASQKFFAHIVHEHKKRIITCHVCYCKLKTSEFLMHFKEHCQTAEKEGNDEIQPNGYSGLKGKEFNCPLCAGSSFPTANHLMEHRKLFHSNSASTYSCTICHRKFDKPSILEAHMNDHEQNPSASFSAEKQDERSSGSNLNDSRVSIKSDPGVATTECQVCGKVFANYQNLRRHIRMTHDMSGRYNCFTCSKTFLREDYWMAHVEKEHRNSAKKVESCPQCPETFDCPQELIAHRRNVHAFDGENLACDICGKEFGSENSLKIHRGHHFRVNSRLSIGNTSATEDKDDWAENMPAVQVILNEGEDSEALFVPNENPSERPSPVKAPTARKSFPNGNAASSQLRNLLQCQVCDDTFTDVADLRTHLWDVHCARNKPEKPFVSGKLTCELCTNVLPDEESLASHMKWHESNPILSNQVRHHRPAQCDVCGLYYSSFNSMKKHRKRHKATLVVNKLSTTRGKKMATTGITCEICHKAFAERITLLKHKAIDHSTIHDSASAESARPRSIKTEPRQPRASNEEPESFDDQEEHPSSSGPKKFVVCSLCRKPLPSMKALFKHRQIAHRIVNDGLAESRMNTSEVDGVQCTLCPKVFSNAANMKQHFTKKHARPTAYTTTYKPTYKPVNKPANKPTFTATAKKPFKCSVAGCNETFQTRSGRKSHVRTHPSLVYKCALCPRHAINAEAMAEHMFSAHKTNRTSGYDGMSLCKKVDIDMYTVKGATGRECPLCRITYPNHKALKIHYLKKHEGTG